MKQEQRDELTKHLNSIDTTGSIKFMDELRQEGVGEYPMSRCADLSQVRWKGKSTDIP